MPPAGPTAPARTTAEELAVIKGQALACTKCGLAQTRTQVVWAAGDLSSEVLFIGEGPGFHEDQQGEPFVGAAGQLLDKLLAEVGTDRSKVAIVNVIKCRPPGNRDPLPDEIEACRPYLEAQLDFMRPLVIITLGNFATKFITGLQIGITKARGQRFQYKDSIVIPTFHPAAALRGGRFGGMSPVDAIRADFQLVGEALAEQRARFAPASEPAAAPEDDRSAEEIDASEQLGLF
ncbi:MAG: uracil-DNA glycosylase [Actinomycetota bacterium]